MFKTGGGGSFANVGLTAGVILPHLDRVFVVLYFLYACG